MRRPLDHRGNIRTKLRTLWHYDLLCHSTVVYRHLKHPAALHCFLFGCLRDSVECSKHFTLDTNRAARHQNIGLPQELRHGTLQTSRASPSMQDNASIPPSMAPCLLHGPPRKMQMEGLRPAVVAAGEDVAGRMHASNLTVMSICPLRCAFVNTLLCHLNCRFWLPLFAENRTFGVSRLQSSNSITTPARAAACKDCAQCISRTNRGMRCAQLHAALTRMVFPASKCRASVHKFTRWPELPATQVRE